MHVRAVAGLPLPCIGDHFASLLQRGEWISGEHETSSDGERRRIRLGPRGGPQRRARRHLRQVLRSHVAQIRHGDTFQRDNVGVLREQPQSFVLPPGNSHQLRCQLHLVGSCRVFPVSGASAFQVVCRCQSHHSWCVHPQQIKH
ncbi:hypothetical protein VPH35_074922 [Triticum aestivum]